MSREKSTGPIARALWYIESHLDRPLTLDDVSDASGMSKFHLARMFGHSVGCSVLRYVRNRRLSRAALHLVSGSPDILQLALEAGYGSHEAFTRAFRDHFGMTPEAVRAVGHIDRQMLQEPLRMSSTQIRTIAPNSLESRPAMRLVGLSRFVGYGNLAAIPSQWLEFQPFIGRIDGQTGSTAYGVCTETTPESDGFIYTAAVEVTGSAEVPKGLVALDFAPRRCAIFHHPDHISTIRTTTKGIFDRWLPQSGEQLSDDGVSLVEVYDKRFDPRSGRGGLDLWVPLKG